MMSLTAFPIAYRIPISRVRSSRLTSMLPLTPTPPKSLYLTHGSYRPVSRIGNLPVATGSETGTSLGHRVTSPRPAICGCCLWARHSQGTLHLEHHGLAGCGGGRSKAEFPLFEPQSPHQREDDKTACQDHIGPHDAQVQPFYHHFGNCHPQYTH